MRWVARLAHRLKHGEVGAPFGQAAHEIQNRVDDAPGQVAAQRADEHRAQIAAARLGDAQRAGEGEHHNQPEQHLRHTINRFQLSLARSGKADHGLDRRPLPLAVEHAHLVLVVPRAGHRGGRKTCTSIRVMSAGVRGTCNAPSESVSCAPVRGAHQRHEAGPLRKHPGNGQLRGRLRAPRRGCASESTNPGSLRGCRR